MISLETDQVDYLASKGYELPQKALSMSAQRDQQLERQNKQIDKLKTIMQEKQAAIENQKMEIQKQREIQRKKLLFKLESDLTERLKKQKETDAKHLKQQQNLQRCSESFCQKRDRLVQQMNSQRQKLIRIGRQKEKDWERAAEIGHKRDQQNQIKAEAMRDIKRAEDLVNVEKWKQYKERVLTLEAAQDALRE